MRLLVSGATDTLRRYRDSPHLGVLLVPGAGNSVQSVLATGLPWAADNAAFTGFNPAAFCAMLGRVAGHPGCLFVACPDVVGDAAATLRLFGQWQPILAALNLPIALVGQDSAENLPLAWEQFQAMFVGGSTDWKLGPGAAALVAEAKRRGKWTHLGRCNTRKRFRHAYRLECDSIDGSGFSRWPDDRIPLALRWLADLHGTPSPEAERRNLLHRFRRHSEGDGPSLLDRPGWVIDSVTMRNGSYRIRAHFAPEMPTCPKCGSNAVIGGVVHRHGTRPQVVRDAPQHGRAVVIVVARRRYRCGKCTQTFLQPIPGLRGRSRFSEEFAWYVADAALSGRCSKVSRDAGIDPKTLRSLLAEAPPLP
jgi:hypothetical protein